MSIHCQHRHFCHQMHATPFPYRHIRGTLVFVSFSTMSATTPSSSLFSATAAVVRVVAPTIRCALMAVAAIKLCVIEHRVRESAVVERERWGGVHARDPGQHGQRGRVSPLKRDEWRLEAHG